ncbi:hypothetical protein F2Q68_00021696 [Brassica cretica]|uniref:Uncharacterized protein n=1 Tax=Brassica cretica TaxID=69181 RepID=A0A8S9FVS1_BRACR|nr:hypothetical protein F2Q68_00021696 [Brassica cretica]
MGERCRGLETAKTVRFRRSVDGNEAARGDRWSGEDGFRRERGLENPILAERACFAAKTIVGIKEREKKGKDFFVELK